MRERERKKKRKKKIGTKTKGEINKIKIHRLDTEKDRNKDISK